MPKVRDTAALSEGDQTWLGSTRGIRTNKTGKLDVTAFTVADGYIPSGTPLGLRTADNELVPYTTGAVDGSQNLYGFLFTDQAVLDGQTELQNVPVMDHGRVRVSRLPVAGFARPAPANDHTTVVYDLT